MARSECSDALRIEHLYLRSGRFWVCDVDLALPAGEAAAIYGKTGAGKSTVIRAVGGAQQPDAGCIRFWGQELYENEAGIRRRMSVVYDEPNFNTELKPSRLVREIRKFEPFFDREAFAAYMEQLELAEDRRVREYSADMVKKLMLALALCRNPELLVLDEPTSGADAETKLLIWQVIDEYRERTGAAVLYTTHHKEEFARAARGICMKNGAVV